MSQRVLKYGPCQLKSERFNSVTKGKHFESNSLAFLQQGNAIWLMGRDYIMITDDRELVLSSHKIPSYHDASCAVCMTIVCSLVFIILPSFISLPQCYNRWDGERLYAVLGLD